jgi:hypothetical protein
MLTYFPRLRGARNRFYQMSDRANRWPARSEVVHRYSWNKLVIEPHRPWHIGRTQLVIHVNQQNGLWLALRDSKSPCRLQVNAKWIFQGTALRLIRDITCPSASRSFFENKFTCVHLHYFLLFNNYSSYLLQFACHFSK